MHKTLHQTFRILHQIIKSLHQTQKSLHQIIKMTPLGFRSITYKTLSFNLGRYHQCIDTTRIFSFHAFKIERYALNF